MSFRFHGSAELWADGEYFQLGECEIEFSHGRYQDETESAHTYDTKLYHNKGLNTKFGKFFSSKTLPFPCTYTLYYHPRGQGASRNIKGEIVVNRHELKTFEGTKLELNFLYIKNIPAESAPKKKAAKKRKR